MKLRGLTPQFHFAATTSEGLSSELPGGSVEMPDGGTAPWSKHPKGPSDRKDPRRCRTLAATLLAIPAGTSGAQASADIMLLHGIPGIDVDVAVDGAVVIPGFEPGDMQDLSSFAGQTLVNLEVRPAGTEDVAIGPVASFDVPASGSWTVVAHLDADGT